MQLQNPTNQSRPCPGLGRNIEPWEITYEENDFVKCEGCRCIVSGVIVDPLTEAAEPESE